MSRYIELAHRPFREAVNLATLSSVSDSEAAPLDAVQDNRPKLSIVPSVSLGEMMTFVVKLRNPITRMWGDQVEVRAPSAADAAEEFAGEHLVEGRGSRDDLRVTVWATPFGSRPSRLFYIPGSPT